MISFIPSEDLIADPSPVIDREWIGTNGIGGYFSGTVAGVVTRRYHGLLVAALDPPLGRTVLVAKIDDSVSFGGRQTPLFANRWSDGSAPVEPDGYRHLTRFRLEGTTPVWSHEIGGAVLDKRIWMEAGANTTYVMYDYRSGPSALRLETMILVNYRDFH
jgi:predicted glycogen debranching enzyme